VRYTWLTSPRSVRLTGLAVSIAALALVITAVRWPDSGQHTVISADRAGSSAKCTGTFLTPASHVQAAIDRARPGTTFCFHAGTYRVSSLVPKSRDVLDGGNQKAVLDGGNSAQFAIYGDSTPHGPSDVTIRGFVIQHFDTPLQAGAIQDYNGPGWIIEDNHITRNAAAGVGTGDYVRVLGNLLDHNGQEGFTAHGNGGLYQGNQIAYNNDNMKINADWEAGGGKAYNTSNLTFKSNYVHDNGGPGLWADTNNINTIFEDNTVSDNWGPGIYDEISFNATIINNTVTLNGMPSAPGKGERGGWGWDAGIELRRSGGLRAAAPVIISGNIVADNYNGISLIESPASSCTDTDPGIKHWHGPCNVQNVLVENNWITTTQGATGGYQDGAGNAVFTKWHNVFRDNHYCVSSVNHPNDGYAYGWWAWLNNYWPDFSSWQILWLQTAGTFTVGGTCRP
jgi:parallel beta-helix repeat protein